jgi:streptogramin lyase
MNSARSRPRDTLPIALAAVVLWGAGAAPARGQAITEFPLPGATKAPGCLSAGAAGDDHLWSADRGTNAAESGIARISTAGEITETLIRGVTLGPGVTLRLQCVTPGPPSDGNVWFTLTENAFGQIGRIAPDGTATVFPTLIQSRLDGIVAGPDGALWFTEGSAGKIGRATTHGIITNHYAIGVASDYPQAITVGPGSDPDLWFTERDGGKIGRITTAGVLTEYAIPTAASSPQSITLGPDGALWFTETGANKIGRITTSGAITEFPLPTANGEPQVITLGPDGAAWFTETAGNRIGRIEPDGSITELAVPTANGQPFGITAGPDGNIWFTESRTNKIGRVTVPESVCGPGRGHAQVLTPATALACVANRS